jgi:hypothetical protein
MMADIETEGEDPNTLCRRNSLADAEKAAFRSVSTIESTTGFKRFSNSNAENRMRAGNCFLSCSRTYIV